MAKINLIKSPNITVAPSNFKTDLNNTRPVHNPIIFSFETETFPQNATFSDGGIFFDISLDLTEGTIISFDGINILVSDTPTANQLPSVDVTVAPIVPPFTSAYPLYYPTSTPNTIANKYLFVVNKLVTILESNPNVNWKYSFVINSNINNLNPANFTIDITAKFLGTRYEPITHTFSSPLILPSNKYLLIPSLVPTTVVPFQSPDVFNFLNAQDDSIGMRDDSVGVYVDVYVDELAEYNGDQTIPPSQEFKTIRLQKYYNANNIIEFDVSKILKNFTKTSIWDDSISNVFQSANEMLIRYYMRYGMIDTFRDTANVTYVDNIGIWNPNFGGNYAQYWAVESSLPLQFNQEVIDVYFKDYYKTNIGYFLSNTPPIKYIMPYQSEWLYFIICKNTNNSLTLSRKIKYYFEDGSTSEDILPNNYIISSYGECFKFKTLDIATKLNKELTSEKKIKQYEIWLIDVVTPNIPISQKKVYSYHYDNECPNIQGEVYFLNELGGFDTIQINGGLSYILDSKRIEYSKSNILSYSYDTQLTSEDASRLSQSDVIAIETNYTVECYTNFLPQDHLEWFKEIVSSKEIYFKNNDYIDGWNSSKRRCGLTSFEYEKDVNRDWYSFKFVLTFNVSLNERI